MNEGCFISNPYASLCAKGWCKDGASSYARPVVIRIHYLLQLIDLLQLLKFASSIPHIIA
jgi:hypothetical protein